MDLESGELREKLKKSAQHGAIRALGYWARLIVEEILTHKPGELGVARATHVCAMVNVVYSALQPQEAGFFDGVLNRQLRAKLNELKATLGPEESRFEDIFGWDRADCTMIRREFRSNFERLVGSNEYSECIVLGLTLHLVFDHYLRLHDPIGREKLGIIKTRDMAERHEFAVLFRSVEDLVEELLKVERAALAA